MQGTAEQSSASTKILVFRTRISAQVTPPLPSAPLPPESKPSWWQQHGTTAAWLAIVVVALVGLFNTGTIWHFRNVDSEAKTSDEHVNILIHDQLNPAVDKINEHIDKKVDPLSQKIDALSERVARLEGPLTKRVSGLETRVNQQTSLAKLIDPRRVLAMIRAEIQTAETSGKLLSASDLVDYKNAVRALPASAYEYWTTAAAIINYQSKINQMSGEAPDPMKVSRTCSGLTAGTGGSNMFVSAIFSNCVVDLDTNDVFQNVTFRDSVIRYKGGPANLLNVTFVNCNFQLNLPPNATPAKPNFLFALLDSPKQTSVRVR